MLPDRLHRLLPWLPRRGRRSAEASRLIVGSTGSGKSEGELADLVRIANRGDYAVVLLDAHGPLAFRSAGHWAARGHGTRLVYEPLLATDRVLCWDMLPRSADRDLSRRRIEDAQTRDEVAQCFLAQRNLDTLHDRPWTKEWLEAAIDLCLSQPSPEPLTSMPAAFATGSPAYERLLAGCDRPQLVTRFREMERLRAKNEAQYQMETGAARRLTELVCGSEVVRLRCRPGPFSWLDALQQRRLVVFDGGGLRTRELKRSLFLLASLQVINAVRRHFAQTQEPLPVVLVLEEAGALGLVTPFVAKALQELRKAGLAIHLITQTCLDFADDRSFEAVLANAPWQGWYQLLAPSDQDLAARALANPTFDAFSVHFRRPRLISGERQDDPYYRSPSLHEQEYRTRLARLRVGERLVRDRDGVRREWTWPVWDGWPWRVTVARTRSLIDQVRRVPLYLPPPGGQLAEDGGDWPDALDRLDD